MRINFIGFQKQHFDTETQLRYAKSGKGHLNCNGGLQLLLEKAGHTAAFGLENADLNVVILSNLYSLIISKKHVIAFDNWVNSHNMTKENTTFLIEDWNIKGIVKSNEKMLEEKEWKTHPSMKGYRLSDKTLEILSWYFEGSKVWLPVHAKTIGDHSNLGVIGKPLFFDPTPLCKYYSDSEIKELKPVYTSLVINKSYFKKNDLNEENTVIIRKGSEQDCIDAIHSHRICMMPTHYHLENQKGKVFWYRNRYLHCYDVNALMVNKCEIEEYDLDWKAINEENYLILLERQKRAYERMFDVSLESQIELVQNTLESLNL